MKGELILSLADRETKDLLVVCVCVILEKETKQTYQQRVQDLCM